MIGGNRVRALAQALKSNSTLTTLDLGYNSTGDNEAQALSKALSTNSTVTTLNVVGHSISSIGAKELSKVFRTSLIRFKGLLAISEVHKAHSTLTTLDLQKNPIGDKRALALSEALDSDNFGLVGKLDRTNGALALSGALKTNSTLTTLYLQKNSIGSNGGQSLSEALKANSTLITVNFWNNSIEDKGAQVLAEALRTNSTLTILVLFQFSVGIPELEWMKMHWPRFQSLRGLYSNGLDCDPVVIVWIKANVPEMDRSLCRRVERRHTREA